MIFFICSNLHSVSCTYLNFRFIRSQRHSELLLRYRFRSDGGAQGFPAGRTSCRFWEELVHEWFCQGNADGVHGAHDQQRYRLVKHDHAVLQRPREKDDGQSVEDAVADKGRLLDFQGKHRTRNDGTANNAEQVKNLGADDSTCVLVRISIIGALNTG